MKTRLGVYNGGSLLDSFEFEKVKRSSDGYISGIVASEEELVTLLENHKRATLTSFNAWSERLSDSSRRRLLWQVEEFCDDVPLCVVKRVILVCQHGKPYSRAAAKEDSSEHVATKKRIHVKKLQKLDCPAKLFIRHVTRYDTYSVKGESSRAKKEEAMKNLKQELSRTNPPTSTFIHVRVPLVEAHRNHTIDARCCYSRRIHPKVRDKIQELVATGKRSLPSVREALEEYVSTELCERELRKPHLEDRAYFPSDTTVQNHIRTALAAGRHSAPDRENLERRAGEWEEEYYRDSFPLVEGEETHRGGGERVRAGRKGAERKGGVRRNAAQRRVKSAKFAFRKELKRLIDDSYSCDDLETFRRSTEVLRNLRRSFLTQCRTEKVQLLREEAVTSGKRVGPSGTQVNIDGQSKQQNGDATRVCCQLR